MIDLKEIENWEDINEKKYSASRKQIFQPYDRYDDRWCGYIWYFVIELINNGTWFLDINLYDVRDGVTYGEGRHLLTEEFYSGTKSQNLKAAMRKAHNIAKAMGLV